jgi:hypothetical protein
MSQMIAARHRNILLAYTACVAIVALILIRVMQNDVSPAPQHTNAQAISDEYDAPRVPLPAGPRKFQ